MDDVKTTITIDIDENNRTYSLSGDIEQLVSRRRARMHLERYSPTIADSHVSIPYTPVDQQQILNGLFRIFEKFGFHTNPSSRIRLLLDAFFRERETFGLFSEKARLIRDNNLSASEKKELEGFLAILNDSFPRRILYPLQLLAAYHMAFSQNVCNFSVPGAGKTSIVYAAYAYLRTMLENSDRRIDRILVIGPLSSFGPWETEYQECFGEKAESTRLAGGASSSFKRSYLFTQPISNI